jgi:hypothetical protein
VTFFLSIRAIQEPFPIGADQFDRAEFSCNYRCNIYGVSADLEKCIGKLLSGIVTISDGSIVGNAGFAPLWEIPDNGPGPYTSIGVTGGVFDIRTHNNTKVTRPSFQVFTVGADYLTVKALQLQIYNVLDNVTNMEVIP